MKQGLVGLDIYTDGSYQTAMGACGGWGVWIKVDEDIIVKGWGPAPGSNNRGELAGVIKALEFATEWGMRQITIHTDSEYVRQNYLNQLERWSSNGWRRADGKQVQNVDLWKALQEAAGNYQTQCGSFELVRVPGHSGDEGNDNADVLAKAGARCDLNQEPGGWHIIEGSDIEVVSGSAADIAEIDDFDVGEVAEHALLSLSRCVGVTNHQFLDHGTGNYVYSMFAPNDTEDKDKKDRNFAVPSANSAGATVVLREQAKLMDFALARANRLEDSDLGLPFVVRWDTLTAKATLANLVETKGQSLTRFGDTWAFVVNDKVNDAILLKRQARLMFEFLDQSTRRLQLLRFVASSDPSVTEVDITDQMVLRTPAPLQNAVLPRAWKAPEAYTEGQVFEHKGKTFTANRDIAEGEKAAADCAVYFDDVTGWKYKIDNGLAQQRFIDVNVPDSKQRARITIGKDLPQLNGLRRILASDPTMRVSVVFAERNEFSVRYHCIITTKDGWAVHDNPYANAAFL